MRQLNDEVLSGSDNQNVTGDKIDCQQLFAASFQASFGDSQAAGTLKLQASNDPCPAGNLPGTFTPTNWTDISGATVNATSGAAALIPKTELSYRWIRSVWTCTATMAQTIAVVGDTAGSLAGKYFLLQGPGTSPAKYAVYFKVSGSGSDPAISGYTGTEVAISTGDNAAAVGTALAAVIDALAEFAASGTTTVTVSNASSGPCVPIANGATLPTGFTFAVTAGGNSSISVKVNALGM